MVRQLTGKYLAHLVFALVALLIVGLGILLNEAATQERASTVLVAHSLEVINAIGDVDDHISLAEAAQRGYLSSAVNSFLSERDRALAETADAVERIKKLTVDNPAQQARIKRLEPLIAARIALMQDRVLQRQNQGIDAATAVPAVAAAQQASIRVSELTAAMTREELRLLAMRRADEQQRYRGAQRILLLAVLGTLLILLPGYVGFVAQARAHAERKLVDMADSLPGAVFQIRSERGNIARGHFEFVSPSIMALCGVEREALLRDKSLFWGCILEQDKPGFIAALKAAAASREPVRHDFRIRSTASATPWLRCSATVRKEPDGSFLWNGFFADVTVQNQLERDLQEAKELAEAANRAKNTFLATVSHEIRTPMTGLLGMLELLSLTQLNAAQRHQLEVARESGKSLQGMIDEILDFSKIEAGKLEVHPEPTSIRETVEAVRNMFSGNASGKGLLLTSSIDPEISPALMVDPMRLRQILSNLVSNAIKFTAEGQVEMKAELLARAGSAERVRFTVKDSGIGISKDDQARLFQPFIQADNDIAMRFGGTGLGLTICQRLAKMMGGTVVLESTLGEGTTLLLELSLPIANPAQLQKTDSRSLAEVLSATTTMRRMAPATADAEAEGSLVLLADDHPINRLVLQRQVNALGYAAECAVNGVEALALWRTGRFGMIITDCNMPGMNGYQLAQSIRALEASNRRKRTPIIACTANALESQAETCLAAGMDSCLTKPIDLQSLAKQLDRWLPILPVPLPLDRAVLQQISDGDSRVEHDILVDFKRVNDADAVLLERAVARRDTAEVLRMSHRIQGASKIVGALGLAAVCERLEGSGRAGDWQMITADLGVFQQELERLNSHCEKILCIFPN